MDEKSLKTSRSQRIIIIVIALLLLGSTVLTYIFVVLNSGSSNNSSISSDATIDELTAQFDAKNAELETAAKPYSDKYLETFKAFRSEVKSYNEASANAGVLDTKDLKEGTGKVLEEGDTDYLAYYIGSCADGTVFQSSFNDFDNPTSLSVPIETSSLVEGWMQGVIGMKVGGVRQITMSGDLAYGDTQEICGGYNKPLRFIVMAIDPDENLSKLNSELQDIWLQLYMAYYGAAS